MSLIRIISIALVAGLAASCHSGPPGNPDDVLLEVGAYRLSVHDYEGMRQQPPYRDLDDRAVAAQLQDDARIMAYAIDHRYDTVRLIGQQLNYALQYYASSVDGYVWNRVVKPQLKVSPEALQQALAWRNDEYLLETICFPSDSIFRVYCKPGYTIASSADFEALRRRVQGNAAVQWSGSYRRYPFFPLGGYLPDLPKAAKGAVYGPVKTLSGYYLIRVADRRKADTASPGATSPQVAQELVMDLQEQFIWKEQKRIMAAAAPRFQEAAIGRLASLAGPGQSWPGIDRSTVVMEYMFNNVRQAFTVGELTEFIQCTPLYQGALDRTDGIRKILEGYLIGRLLYQRGKELGMESDPVFLLTRERYRQSLFIKYFKKTVVQPQIVIEDADLHNFFDAHRDDFTGYEEATVLAYRFTEMTAAFAGRQKLLGQWQPGMSRTDSAARQAGRELPPAGRWLLHSQDTLHSQAIVEAVCSLEPGGLSMPLAGQGAYWVVRLMDRKGRAVLPFKYARARVYRQLHALQEKELIPTLTASYPIKINLIADYQSAISQ